MGFLDRILQRRKALACAIIDDKALAICACYDPRKREIHVDFARSGTVGKGMKHDFVDDLPWRFRHKPVWVPVYVETLAQQNNVHVLGIDAMESTSRSKVELLANTQLQEVEADGNADYARTVAEYLTDDGDASWIGGTLPRDTIDRTFDYWRKNKRFARPRVGSRHVGLVNLYLALHDKIDNATADYTLLSYWSHLLDFFCLMKGSAFLDSGNSIADSDDFAGHIKKMNGWVGDFKERRMISKDAAFSGCVVSVEDTYKPEGWSDGTLEFWPIPWDKVKCANDAIKAILFENKELAVMALGLAMHGV